MIQMYIEKKIVSIPPITFLFFPPVIGGMSSSLNINNHLSFHINKSADIDKIKVNVRNIKIRITIVGILL